MTNDRTIFKFTETTLQSLAEANIDRELTDQELKRLTCLTADDDHFMPTIYGAFIDLIRTLIDPESDWSVYDEYVRDKTLEDILK